MLKQLNKIRCKPEDMAQVLEEFAALPFERRHFEAGIGIISRIVKGSMDCRIAMAFRLEALSRLLQDGPLGGFSLSVVGTGTAYLKEPVVRVACKCPMKEGVDGRATFEREQFLQMIEGEK